MSGSRVFVSHSHQDNAYCRAFVAGLRAKGFAVWYDEHNLGWGALRPTIEREMLQCRHFIAILSPAAVSSEWVNAEIDAGLVLLQQGILRTFTFVVAQPCEVPLLLRRWKRIEVPDGTAVSAADAVAKAVAILTSVADAPAAQNVLPTPQPALPEKPGPAPQPANATTAHHLTPMSLYNLGFRGWNVGGVECVLSPICPVPGGVFTMGSDKSADKQAQNNEIPQYPVQVDNFAIGQHPVTVAEYACAVRTKAVREPPPHGSSGTNMDWLKQATRLDHPVVCVSWSDALDYTRWLAKTTNQAWRLPTEAEWEKMARWDFVLRRARIYPWGDSFDNKRCNTSESRIGGTTPVGSYPGGASPYGVQDVAGNVLEWTSSLCMPYAYNPNDGREDPDSSKSRALHGGFWSASGVLARAAHRGEGLPESAIATIGFRLALGESSPGTSATVLASAQRFAAGWRRATH